MKWTEQALAQIRLICKTGLSVYEEERIEELRLRGIKLNQRRWGHA
jgi:hypothetical protein